MQGFGQRLRAAREAKGWTQEQLAGYSGIRTPEISRLERGRRMPMATTLYKLCWALEVSSDELLGLPTFVSDFDKARNAQCEADSYPFGDDPH